MKKKKDKFFEKRIAQKQFETYKARSYRKYNDLKIILVDKVVILVVSYLDLVFCQAFSFF